MSDIILAWAAAIVAALLARHPSMHARRPADRARVTANVAAILTACDEAHVTRRMCAHAVAECFAESGLQSRRPTASLCGCQPYDTSPAVQARCAVRAVADALATCDTSAEASGRYVSGVCRVAPSAPPAWRRNVARYAAAVESTRELVERAREVLCAR